MKVVDANRIFGPIPTGDVPSADAPRLLAELDRLAIDAACVVHSYALHYDPTAPHELPDHPRLFPVPVVVPGPLGTSAPADGVRVVRLCPAEHRFALTGSHGLQMAQDLADRGITVLLGWESASFGEIDRLAGELPGLGIVLINTGYRSLRQLADLMDEHSGIRVDTATLSGHQSVEWIARRYGPHRVLFGTGAPASDDTGPRFQLDHLDLPAADVELIAGGNVLELLR
ncbi:amidohydrolase family protein [Kribbella sp. VKM Ac-2527]|uniref:Amidohydrolase family protein n=1 Tax=Kribbella caucasensis TaxID=2512215 RepID=A0A4V3C751_9ACTN|nr:amidohydrolase family protein [Kribbella sp. VKM Ac-2527]TDO36378.1 amidohydrolase family protein [Kribbella sp. VKM Ac-2527]